ncbi:uncharacterized protein [Clytia hemisphaerica]
MCDGEDQSLDATTEQRKLCVEEHNKLRRLHRDTQPLEWDFMLALKAQRYARYLTNTINLEHDADGENLFVKMGSNGTTQWTCHSATMAWYNEIKHFDSKTLKSTNNQSVMHFEQVVWKSAERIGVGIAYHKKLKFVYLVARYDQTIMAGEEKDNVMPVY